MFWKSYPKKYLCTHSLESKAPFGWDENTKDGKKGTENREENTIFPYLVQERKQEGNKIMKIKITLGPQIFKACLETHKTEWYHSILVTHDPKLMGPTDEFLFGWVLSHGCECQNWMWVTKTENRFHLFSKLKNWVSVASR